MLKSDEVEQDISKKHPQIKAKSFISGLVVKEIDYNVKNRKKYFSAIQYYLNQAIEEEARFGHGFLWLSVALVMGAYFNFTRQNDIPDLAVIIPILVFVAVLVLTKELATKTRFCLACTLSFFIGIFAANIEMKKSVILLDQSVTTHINGYVVSKQMDANNIPRYIIAIDETYDPIIRRPPQRVQLVARARHEGLEIGQKITGRARLTRPSGPVFPGGYDFAFNAYIRDIGAYGFFMGAPVYAGEIEIEKKSLNMRFELFVRDIQARISKRIKRQLSGDAAGIILALTISDRRAISEDTIIALRQAGLAHVLAISGLHMVLASGTLFFTLRLIFSLFPAAVQAMPIKKISAIGAIFAATGYLIISGAPISAQRAWIMLVVVLIAIIVDRPALTLRNVAIAAIVIVLLSPSAVMTPGFQMSFSAVAALVSVYGIFSRRSNVLSEKFLFIYSPSFFMRGIRIIFGLAITALIAGLATGIFSSQHFFHLAGFGILGNVLAMPIVTFLVMPLVLLSVLLLPYGLEAWPLIALGETINQVIEIAYWVSYLDGDIVSGKLISWAVLLMNFGFIIFICMRSQLRYIGLGLIVIGGWVSVMFPILTPDIFISENGKIIGLHKNGVLEINRVRPSKFVTNQWLDAYRLDMKKPLLKYTRLEAKNILKLDTSKLWQQFHKKSNEERDEEQDGFTCLNSHFCFNEIDGLSIVTIGKVEYLQFVCGQADIMITSLNLRARQFNCPQMQVIDQKSLKKSGSIVMYLADKNNKTGPRIKRIRTAINNDVRPWTIQRYFDWRRQTYDLPYSENFKNYSNVSGDNS